MQVLSTVAVVGGLVLSTAPQAAAAVPYRDWTQAPGNAAGVVFDPCGDDWRLWDNVNDGLSASARFNYKGVKDRWKTVMFVKDGYGHASRNVSEKYHIYFQVRSPYGDSPIVEYRTSGCP
ncbi:hypothetical protein FM076_00440 [Streptomyces albus subsp. chlorinus]|uniref:hypothetical protein n=1 Tax=Streptomyces albus TaxID=1888 RepID=UPI00156FFCEA|nr:hypothetical protein [Streptomyces albus]NSC19772.1 hypothetical protein [Streptomyces albus subsp. chlorinus]